MKRLRLILLLAGCSCVARPTVISHGTMCDGGKTCCLNATTTLDVGRRLRLPGGKGAVIHVGYRAFYLSKSSSGHFLLSNGGSWAIPVESPALPGVFGRMNFQALVLDSMKTLVECDARTYGLLDAETRLLIEQVKKGSQPRIEAEAVSGEALTGTFKYTHPIRATTEGVGELR